MRANDPIYEIALRLGGQQQEDAFWEHTLKSLAAEFGVKEPVQIKTICVDPRLQWFQAKNIWQNAAIRTLFYKLGTSICWFLYQQK